MEHGWRLRTCSEDDEGMNDRQVGKELGSTDQSSEQESSVGSVALPPEAASTSASGKALVPC